MSLVVVLALAWVALASSASLSENTDESSDEGSDELDSLINTVQRGLLAQMLLKQKLRGEDLAGEDGRLEKRFSKWQKGETRSRVRLLNQNHDASEFGSANGNSNHNPPLRKIWENNMREKNKMYESLLG